MRAPPTQKLPKISHEPSVLRTSRMVATAAPESTAEATPTSCQVPRPIMPAGVSPSVTSATPTVVTASAPTAPRPSGSSRNSAAHSAVNTGAV